LTKIIKYTILILVYSSLTLKEGGMLKRSKNAPWYPFDLETYEIDYEAPLDSLLTHFRGIPEEMRGGELFKPQKIEAGVCKVSLGILRFIKSQSIVSCLGKMAKAHILQANIWELVAYCLKYPTPVGLPEPEGLGVIACADLVDDGLTYRVPMPHFISDESGFGRRLGLTDVTDIPIGSEIGFLVKIPWIEPDE
jgi:hypothetical protein